MLVLSMVCIRIPGGILTVGGEYEPFDPAPTGYIDKQEWAKVQMKAGLKQVRCSLCGRYCFPSQLHRCDRHEYEAYRSKRDAKAKRNPVTVVEWRPICLECNKEPSDG